MTPFYNFDSSFFISLPPSKCSVQTYINTDKQTDRQKDEKTYELTDWLTDIQSDIHSYIQTDMHTYIHAYEYVQRDRNTCRFLRLKMDLQIDREADR